MKVTDLIAKILKKINRIKSPIVNELSINPNS